MFFSYFLMNTKLNITFFTIMLNVKINKKINTTFIKKKKNQKQINCF